MLGRFHRFVDRFFWWVIPVTASMVMFDVWFSWAREKPASGAALGGVAILSAWVWLHAIEGRS